MRRVDMRRIRVELVAAALVSAAFAGSVWGCSAVTNPNQFDGGAGGNGSGTGMGGDLGLSTGTSMGTGPGEILTQEPPCNVDPNIDNDGDGWTGAQGDCNDCTRQMNPGALDWPGNNIDEDCNGAKDDNPVNCDGALSVSSSQAVDGAKAMGLCKMQMGESWGLISAEYVTAGGMPLSGYDPSGIGHGILKKFGPTVNPQEGGAMLVLSSGTARTPSDPGYQPVEGYDKLYSTTAPTGFPKESPSCPGVMTGEPHDSVGLRVRVKTPSNAKSLKFNLNFYTYEFPQYVCSQFNDFFVALLSPAPQMYPDGNISFDSQGNLISVNAGFLQVCHPQQAGGKNFPCPLGPSQLTGTGFDEDQFGFYPDNSAATGWLQTNTPVAPSTEISLLFTIWDSGDGILDSTVLLDNIAFDVEDLGTGTAPIDTPK